MYSNTVLIGNWSEERLRNEVVIYAIHADSYTVK